MEEEILSLFSLLMVPKQGRGKTFLSLFYFIFFLFFLSLLVFLSLGLEKIMGKGSINSLGCTEKCETQP